MPALLVFGAAAVVMYLRFGNMVIADAVAYLAVTERLLDGDFTGSINGYWSPLVSWLLLPFKAAGMPGIAAFQLLNLLLAAGCLWQLYRLLLALKTPIPLQTAVLCGAAALLPFWAFNYLTADVLFLLLLLWYSLLHVEQRFFKRPFVMMVCGALLYLAKAYGLFFFIAHSGCMLLYNYVTEKQALQWKRVFAGYFLTAVVCGLWIAAISARYGRFTVSEAGAYNRSIVQSGRIIHPCDTLGLLPLRPGERFFAWEEMTRHVSYPAPALNVLTAVSNNTPAIVRLLVKSPRYGVFVFSLLFTALLFVKQRPGRDWFCLVAALLLFTGGYCLFFAEERYFLYPVLLLGLLIATGVAQLWPEGWRHWLWLPAVVLAYMLLRPVADGYRHTVTADEDATVRIARQLRHYGGGKRYASWQPYQFATLAYYNNWQDAGGLAGYGQDSVRMLDDLKRYQVQFVLLPDGIRLPENVAAAYPVYVYKYENIGVWRGVNGR